MAAVRKAKQATRLELWLPGSPVSVNSMYTRRQGRVYLRPEARTWKAYVRDVVGYEAKVAGFPTGDTLRGVRVTYVCVRSRGDADNYAKLLFDGIADGLGVNDRIFSIGGASCERGQRDRGYAHLPGVRLVIEATEVATVEGGAA